MNAPTSPATRFQECRERAGLSHDEVAKRFDPLLSSACIWDIESHDDELSSCYSPHQVQRFSLILGVRPIDLFGGEITEPPIAAVELVQLIREQCRLRCVTLDQFEDAVGWRLSACIEPPEHLLEDISIDGLQWLCRELGVDWKRVILGL
jgi:hypothetical protein